MPATWKKGKLLGIGRLLTSDHRHGPKAPAPLDAHALTNTGAARPRKTPRRPYHRPSASEGGAGFSTMASLASEIIAASASSATPWSRMPPVSPPPESPDVAPLQLQLQQQEEWTPVASEGVKSSGEEEEEEEEEAEGLSDGETPPSSCPTAAEAWPDRASAVACGEKAWRDEVLQSLIGTEVLRKEILQCLPGSKVPPTKEVFHAFPGAMSPETPKHDALEGCDEPDPVGDGFPRSLAGSDQVIEDGVCHGSPQTNVEEDDQSMESSPTVGEAEEGAPEGGGRSKGVFLTLAKVLLFLLLLVFVAKKMALGVSISALAALFIEAIGKRLMTSPKPPKEAEEALVAAAPEIVPVSGETQDGETQLTGGSDSPGSEREEPIPIMFSEICELGSASEESWDVHAPLEDPSLAEQTPVSSSSGEKDLVEIGDGFGDYRPRRRNGKTRKLLSKLVRRSSASSSLGREER